MRKLRISPRFRLTLALGVLLALVFSIQMPIYAQVTFFVDDLVNDSNDATPGDGICSDGTGAPSCTLRAALEESNALAGSDTINFSTTGTLVLTLGQLWASDSVTISATTGGTVYVDGNLTFRTFLVGDPVAVVAPTVNVTNIGFINGTGLGNVAGAPRSEGGCIFVSAGGSLTMNSSVVRDCSSSGFGGGIYGDGGVGGAAPSVINLYQTTTVRGNFAANGGGIYSLTGTVRVQTEACVLNNTAGTDGGGIYGGDDTNVIVGGGAGNRGWIVNNHAVNGGGIFLFINAGFAGDHARLYNNDADASGNRGAAWHASGGTYGTFGAGRSCVNCCIVANSWPFSSSRYAVYQPFNGNTSTWNGNWWGDNWGPMMYDLNPAQNKTPESGSNVSNGDGISGFGTGASPSRVIVSVSAPNNYGDWSTIPTGNWLTTTAGNVPADCVTALCTTASSIGPNRTCPAPNTCGLGW